MLEALDKFLLLPNLQLYGHGPEVGIEDLGNDGADALLCSALEQVVREAGESRFDVRNLYLWAPTSATLTAPAVVASALLLAVGIVYVAPLALFHSLCPTPITGRLYKGAYTQ